MCEGISGCRWTSKAGWRTISLLPIADTTNIAHLLVFVVIFIAISGCCICRFLRRIPMYIF